MKRLFNIAGPCIAGKHYLLPSNSRCPGIGELIEDEQFFVIHAARQSGKTTLLQNLVSTLNSSRDYVAVYCSLESVQIFDKPEKGIPGIVECIRMSLDFHPLLSDIIINYDSILSKASNGMLRPLFTDLCRSVDRPVVFFFDEADCLRGDTLNTFLRQLRDGYVNRSMVPFVHSLALVGMSNIRDYKARIRDNRETLGSVSPFNIVTEAKTLRNFTRDEIAVLYQQHTNDTGQEFPDEAVDRAYYWTEGQPWLTNALAREVVEKILGRDFSKAIQTGMIDDAADRIMRRRDTHLDSLLERLKEDRVRNIIQPMLLGQEGKIDRNSDDFEYVKALGLICNERGVIRPANPMYGEVIARTLNYNAQEDLTPDLLNRWVENDAILMNDLLKGFQQFWRENSESWVERFEYREAAPQLILQAYLQRVVNGGARIIREFAAGSGRIDLCVRYKDKSYPIELKVRREKGKEPLKDGPEQTRRYMDIYGAKEGWLVIFDQRPELSWNEKISWTTETNDDKTLHILGS